MPIEIVITQKCDICGKEETLMAEADARTVEVNGETLVLCEPHRDEALKLKALLKDAAKIKNALVYIWRRLDPMVTEWLG